LAEGKETRVFNLGCGSGYSVKQVVDKARAITACAIPVVIEPRRAGDPAILIASSEHARTELGWSPRYENLDDIIGSAWQWHRTHPNGYGTMAATAVG
jgi:UDP-glucose 4-epimerase